MALDDFVPSAAYNKFEEENGEDTFIKLNLMYIAMELNEIYDEVNNTKGEFDELCADVLEMYLDERFDSFNVEDIADAVMFIMSDSNYSISLYTKTYRQRKEECLDELEAYLNKKRKEYVDSLTD